MLSLLSFAHVLVGEPASTSPEHALIISKPNDLVAPMLEKRKSERRLTLRTGKISSIDASGQIDCAVLDVSQSGACILVPDSSPIAEFFELAIDREGAVRACRRVWQQGSRIGLAFMDGMEQAPHE